MFTEEKRQIVHILLFIFAFFLKYLARWQAAILLAALLIITLAWVPHSRVKNYLYRHFEKKYSEGGVLYFLVLLVLILIFPLPVVAASWAILAWGDGAATLVGQNFKAKELPWNKKKSYAGSIAFVIFGTLGAFILLKWMLPDMSGNAALLVGLKATLIAALVESLPLKLNDNVSVALASALVINFLI
jgi:dolichol kinase